MIQEPYPGWPVSGRHPLFTAEAIERARAVMGQNLDVPQATCDEPCEGVELEDGRAFRWVSQTVFADLDMRERAELFPSTLIGLAVGLAAAVRFSIPPGHELLWRVYPFFAQMIRTDDAWAVNTGTWGQRKLWRTKATAVYLPIPEGMSWKPFGQPTTNAFATDQPAQDRFLISRNGTDALSMGARC